MYSINYISVHVLDYLHFSACTRLPTFQCMYWITYISEHVLDYLHFSACTRLPTFQCMYSITYISVHVLDYLHFGACTRLPTFQCMYSASLKIALIMQIVGSSSRFQNIIANFRSRFILFLIFKLPILQSYRGVS